MQEWEGVERVELQREPEQLSFEIDLTDPDNGITWMSPVTDLLVGVEEFEVRGPLN